MKLVRVQAQNFRSIVDSGEVEIEERVTVLIGRNEQGKTNLLKALASYDPKRSYAPNDLPTHLRPALEERKPSDIPVVSLWLALSQSDREKFRDIIADVEAIDLVKTTRYYDGHYSYSAVKKGKSESKIPFARPKLDTFFAEMKSHAMELKDKLTAHAARVPAFAPGLSQAQTHIDQFASASFETGQIENLVKAFAGGLNSLPGQDQAIQEDIASALSQIQAKQGEIEKVLQRDPVKLFEQALPHFVLHSITLDRIPNDINISNFVKDPEGTSKGMANLCAVAGLSTQKIKELAAAKDPTRRDSYEDHYRGKISGGLNEFWNQEHYTVHFRIGSDKLEVSISDGTYTQRIAPLDRSDGFQWYLSFYSALLSEVSAGDSTVLLLDNPGLELHPDGQRDIKGFLEEKLPQATQVIYVTHSPAMIDTYNLEQVRQVELRGNEQGTKVSKLIAKPGKDFDLLEPVRSAIGASLVSSLTLNEFNVLVEGRSDKPILESAFWLLDKDLVKKVLVNGSLAEAKEAFIARFYERAKLPYTIVLDADSAGRELATGLKKWDIPDARVVMGGGLTKEEIGKDEFAVEDFVSPEFYHLAVADAYPDHNVDQPPNGKGKRTKHYEVKFKEQFGIGFDKRRVAESLKKLVINGKADAPTVERLKKVATNILANLKGQVEATKK